MSHEHSTSHQREAGVEPDLQFIDGMTEHHQGAVTMARKVLDQPAARDELRKLAQDIVRDQESEIAQFRAWREEWYPRAPRADTSHMHMGDMEIDADATVPFEERFLRAMISHHQGALAMAEDAGRQTRRPEIEDVTARIIAAQKGEIAQMQRWRQEWSRS